jgi:Lon-like ATP-dependent protease
VKAGIHKVLIPKANAGDVLIEERYRPLVEVVPVENIEEVLTHALIPEQREGFLARIRNLAVRSSTKILDTTLPKPVV